MASRIVKWTWPLWVPLFLVGLGLYLLVAAVVITARLVWDLIQLPGRTRKEREERHRRNVEEWERRNELERREMWIRHPQNRISDERRAELLAELHREAWDERRLPRRP